MRALVVYESIFGNTRAIAEAIGRGLAADDGVVVDVFEISDAPADLEGVDLLVLGGPIHAWGMTRESTRSGARNEAEQKHLAVVSKGDGMREWITQLQEPDHTVLVATFDTASQMPAWFPVGSAARPAARKLAELGMRGVSDAEHFFVHGKYGPICQGEEDRAEAWGAGLQVR